MVYTVKRSASENQRIRESEIATNKTLSSFKALATNLLAVTNSVAKRWPKIPIILAKNNETLIQLMGEPGYIAFYFSNYNILNVCPGRSNKWLVVTSK